MTAWHALRQPSTTFRILGPVEYFNGQRWAPIGAAKQRTLLAVLLLNANRLVPAQQLHADLWGDGLPARASSSLAGCVWRLRAALGDPSGELLLTRPAGYQLTVPPGSLDLHEYEALVATGRAQRTAGDLAGAMDSFGAALTMWRGAPLADVALTPSVMAESARLEESRLAVMEADFGVKIALGRHEEILPELKLLVSQHPLRERLHEHLMVGLYRTGQQAEALGAYRDLRRLLLDELGVDPSKPLRELQQRILEEDPSLLDVAVRPSTRLSPTGSHHGSATGSPTGAHTGLHAGFPEQSSVFVGRETELTALTTLLTAGQPVCSVHGLAGSGKSALAVRAAHAAADSFPDGRLYLDMRGTAGEVALRPDEAVQAVLRALGPTGPFGQSGPSGPREEATDQLPSVLAGRKVLIVLDDVRDADQIRPLLPPPPGCSLLVAGRAPLGGVDGLSHLRLGRLSVSASVQLLRRHVGAPRIAVDLGSAAELARQCEYLPLSLRLAADRLAQRPDWTVEEFARQLVEPQQRLALLASGGASLRDSLRASIHLLEGGVDGPAWSAVRLLGALDLTVVSAQVLAALLGTPKSQAHAVAESLVDAGLIESITIDRYRVPEAVRILAREADGSHPEADEAVQRVVDHYIAAVRSQVEQPATEPREPPPDAAAVPRLTTRAWYRGQRETLHALAVRDRSNTLNQALDRLHGRLSTDSSHTRLASRMTK